LFSGDQRLSLVLNPRGSWTKIELWSQSPLRNHSPKTVWASRTVCQADENTKASFPHRLPPRVARDFQGDVNNFQVDTLVTAGPCSLSKTLSIASLLCTIYSDDPLEDYVDIQLVNHGTEQSKYIQPTLRSTDDIIFVDRMSGPDLMATWGVSGNKE